MTEREMKQGRCLAIDTSTSAMTVAILENGHLLGEISSHAERNHSIGLLPHIQDLLARLGMKPRDLRFVAAGQGPGSYTGVRIAVSVAKTFAWSLGLDLIGISSLEAMALGGSVKNDYLTDGITWVIPLMDGRRKQAFTAVYRYEGATAITADRAPDASWTEVLADGIRVIGAWTEQVLTLAKSNTSEAPTHIVFVGETAGFATELERFASEFTGQVSVIPYGIEAEYIGLLAHPRYARGERADVHTFVPNYTRLPEAEANLLSGLQTKKGEL
ncbi:tRNA (adenosine(37)-N6)-threonylcarbamoyltransferase complex dimerization subunit type 1 TsaB [Paenibacillus roseipurpureus]|uniref:tRNA (Adenosine(37)-N6)-threonylcarbamoyltransferase complex dimerization subunit type 1 TsaB n=1 Tax=Paenibacillus roseopurpureus TaxID=2918901 RepID=A0AA96LLE0_9BACL|nr:tRNA (adenosine(37)-N6)-threonylcarbamoyltransferase complex dimerization subunit type 1 TsaB [Paenibacillus sp. MBLB1832]WNR43905.1 tRNA (adenosine(37)-N6)-threonylcarbamoyltransferase complex dimerization subunit type 1 TsaB [Paenibacillus sp. MBLB1832]